MIERWRRWRRDRTLARRPIPDHLWQLTLARFPFLGRRAPDRVAALRELATLFLADKEFTGAHGLEVDDAMAVAIAAQACLPILELGLHWYESFKGIVVHEDAVVASREYMDEAGVVHAFDEELSGEAMQGGPVMLAWRDVAEAGESAELGYNVVIHEFVHVIDMRDGDADGIPPLADAAARDAWMAVFDPAFEAFCEQVDAGRETRLDPYGAEAPEEFFAVASEMFFVAPDDLLIEHPAIYHLLVGFFRQDPAAFPDEQKRRG